MADWTSSTSSGWGESSTSGWGNDQPNSDDKGGGAGWGDDQSNSDKRGGGVRGQGNGSSDNNSGGGGWGDDQSSSDTRGRGRGRGGGGWGDRGGGRGRGRGDRGGGSGGWGNSSNNNNSGGGGWGGDSSDNKSSGWGNSSSDNNSGGGGWGGGSSDNKSSGWGNSSSDKNSGGGWGSGGSSDRKSSGWGNSSSENKSGGGGGGGGWGGSSGGGFGGWGEDRPNNSDDQPRKRFKEDESGEERPEPFKPADLDLDEEAQLQGDGVGANFKKYDEQKVICLPPGSVTPIEKFEDVIKSELLLQNIKTQKYAGMTPIQKWSMPAILAKRDLIGCAQTGSGKTAAFLLPVLQDLLSSQLEPVDPGSECQNPYCVIISPTRELARQISVHAELLSRDSIIRCVVIYGQIATGHLRSSLSRGCHILVATPGRLKDFVERGWIGFKNVRYMILDEGDRLCDEGFSKDIQNFFNHESMPAKEERQTLFFSATFKDDIQLSAKEYLKNDFIFLTVGRIGAANDDIKQEFLAVSRQEKKRELKKILMEVPATDKTIIFTQTKMAADMLAGFFTALNLSSTSIHGDRHQSQREQAIRAFKKGEKRFLISSPVGNRGLDLPKVSLVINYDLPNNIDEYVHRIGRTGRAGHTGRAISFYDEERDRELLPQLVEILKEVKQDIPDWMQGGSSFGSSLAITGAADSWDTGPSTTDNSTSANQPASSFDDWGAPATSENSGAPPTISDNWGVTKTEPEDKANTTTSAADSW